MARFNAEHKQDRDMEGLLSGYQVNEETWFYLSLLLIVAIFFRFSRVWSLRNLDLTLLLALSPGLLFLRERTSVGDVWLFAATGVVLVRLFFDTLLTRRPRMEQNLNTAGMTFLCLATFVFLTTKVIVDPPSQKTMEVVQNSDSMIHRQTVDPNSPNATTPAETENAGPGAVLLHAPGVLASKVVTPADGVSGQELTGSDYVAARITAVFAHLMVVLGLITFGKVHFRNLHSGIAMGMLYLLLPCTAYDVQEVNHVLPAGLIVWAFVAYRKPIVSGCLIGLACGTLYFPIFLLPLWMVFYGRKGALRFTGALVAVAAVLIGSFALITPDVQTFMNKSFGWFNWKTLDFLSSGGRGFWSDIGAAYRLPIFAAYLIMLTCLVIWPRKKNLEHLLGYSTAIIVGTLFWYPVQGPIYLLWYLPLTIMVVFRPRLGHLQSPFAEEKKATEQREPVEPASGSAIGQSAASSPPIASPANSNSNGNGSVSPATSPITTRMFR